MQRDQRDRLAQVSLARGGPAKTHVPGHHLLRDTWATRFVETGPPGLWPPLTCFCVLHGAAGSLYLFAYVFLASSPRKAGLPRQGTGLFGSLCVFRTQTDGGTSVKSTSASNCMKKTWPGPDSCSVDKATKGKEMRNKGLQTPVRTILPLRPEPPSVLTAALGSKDCTFNNKHPSTLFMQFTYLCSFGGNP